jgi:peptidoglycan/xylan/chitin deacetylase (PgdA/CDA1 family)
MIEAAIATIGAGLITAGAYLSPAGFRVLAVRRLRRLCRETGTLVLTYDDGPSADLTPRVLEVLRRHRARASFFLLGRHVERGRHITEQMVLEGHELGCHSYRHRNAWKDWPWSCIDDINRGYQTLSTWAPATAPFRPPYGKLTLATSLAIRRRGARLAWWTIDSEDVKPALPDPERILRRVREECGGVVLLHDSDRQTPDAQTRARFVIEMTERLLLVARESGLVVRTLGDLLGSAADRAPAVAAATPESG